MKSPENRRLTEVFKFAKIRLTLKAKFRDDL